MFDAKEKIKENILCGDTLEGEKECKITTSVGRRA